MKQIISISHNTLEKFQLNNPALVKVPSQVVHLGLPLRTDGAVECETSGGHRGLRVLAVSRLTRADRYKGIRHLLDAVEWVSGQSAEVTLTIVGDGDDRVELAAYAAQLSSKQRIVFRGHISDEELKQEYLKSDLFALPSTGEGFGYVFVEAMSFGLACICTTADSVKEIVQDGVTGFAVVPEDPVAIGKKLLLLASDCELCRRMGQAGAERVQSEFSVEKFEERLGQALRPLLPK